MAVNVKFDLVGNPEPPTIILAKRNGDKLGQLDVNAESIELSDKFNDASEISFTLNKYVDGKLTPLWDKVVDFKLVWCKEWDLWFEIKVELDEATETVKTVFCTQLGQAELSQINLYDIHINEEGDPNWNTENKEYKSTILYDPNDTDASLLHRLLKDKAPHYSILHVDDTIKNIQRSFSFDDTSIYDAFQEVSEEIGCLFVYHSNSGEGGKIQRTISVYDLQQNCLNHDCRHRGEFTDKCPKCGGTNINYNEDVFEDTRIFVTSDELASEGIQLTTDTDSVKNCFKLKGGDDLMTATIRNCNPNGTDYLWRFSDMTKDDMSEELVDAINSYDSRYKDYYDKHESELDATLLNQYNALVEKYKDYYNTESTCLSCGNKAVFDGDCPKCNSSNILSGKSLQSIPATIKGYSALMNAYYNTIDFALYLQSALMPTVKMSKTSAEEQADLLSATFPSSVAVNTEYIDSVTKTTADSAALSMAKIIVKSTYKVEVNNSTYDKSTKTWTGSFVITNYSDEEDTYDSGVIGATVVKNDEILAKQLIEKELNKKDVEDYSISGLFKFKEDEDSGFEFEKSYDEFCTELNKYALNPLKSLYEACGSCLDILINQGAGNEGEKPDLYKNLYKPYLERSSAIAAEIAIRENEIIVIEGEWDKTDEKNPVLKTDGLQQCIERCRNEIQSNLNFEEYLGKDLWLEFCSYRRDDTYSNDNYVSDGLNNAQLFERALKFIEAAENEIYKSSELQHSISTSLNNLLKIDKFKSLVDSFAVGNWIRVRVDDEIFKLRLLEYDIDFGSFENISVEFSDVTKIKNGITDIKDVIDQASSMATNYSSIQRQADQGNKARTTIDQWITDGLNSALVRIQNNSDEEVTMTENGLLCRSYDDITGNYSPEQFRLTHNTMAYTTDDWQTVSAALGKHDYVYYDSDKKRQSGTDYGLSSKFVNAGYISGSQIIGGEIYSDDYSVVDNTGSYINLRKGTFSLGGGSLRYEEDVNGSLKLLISSPDIPTSETITEINEEYLKTTSVYAQNLIVNSTKINGQLTAKQINTEGLIAENISGSTITGKTINGGSITIGSNFSVNTSGDLTSKSGDIAGFTIKDTALYKGTDSLYSKTNGVYVGVDGIRTVTDKGIVTHAEDYSKYQYFDNDSAYLEVTPMGINFCTIANNAMTYPSRARFYYNNSLRGVIDAEQGIIGKDDLVALNWDRDAYFNSVVISKGLTLHGGVELGTTRSIYADNTKAIYISNTGSAVTSLGTTGSVRFAMDAVQPGATESMTLGSASYKWKDIYAATSEINSSDRNIKDNISSLTDIHEQFFMRLLPVSFTFKNGTSGRTHIGFISQDVEDIMEELGMKSLDFAGFCKDVKMKPSVNGDGEEPDLDEDGNLQYIYSLRYGEFIALNTYMIQKLSQRIANLENRLN